MSETQEIDPFTGRPVESVSGWATVAGDDAAHAFPWKDGELTDLSGAASPDCTVAESLNDHDQVVGHTCDETTALLWANGKEYDLTSLAGATDVQLTVAVRVDDQGRIAAEGLLPDGNQHVFLLEPTGESLADAVSRRRGDHRSGVDALIRRSMRGRTFR